MTSALVLGGAGFIGSTICRYFVSRGIDVTVVDGLMQRTSGNSENLAGIAANLQFIAQPVEDVKSLPDLLCRHDFVVDAMGWTRHRDAVEDPAYDLALNVESHAAVIRALPRSCRTRIIYLGSAHPYGRTDRTPIAETRPLMPVDVQGVHKAAAEQHYRIAAEQYRLSIVSLRFGNTFGPGQQLGGGDIGLIGDMIQRALAGETITVFGHGRRRTVHYALDLARIVDRIAEHEVAGFAAINVPGDHVAIAELAKQIVVCAGGAVAEAVLPDAIAAVDVGNVQLDCRLFERLFGKPDLTPLPQAIAATVVDARAKLRV